MQCAAPSRSWIINAAAEASAHLHPVRDTLTDDRQSPISVYLDVCCLGRPFDDQTQPRIHMEAEAIAAILLRARRGELRWISSEVVDYEIERTPDATRRARMRNAAADASQAVRVNQSIRMRANELSAAGLDPFDALHVACAEHGGASVLLTADDVLVRRTHRLGNTLKIRVINPLTWLGEMGRT